MPQAAAAAFAVQHQHEGVELDGTEDVSELRGRQLKDFGVQGKRSEGLPPNQAELLAELPDQPVILTVTFATLQMRRGQGINTLIIMHVSVSDPPGTQEHSRQRQTTPASSIPRHLVFDGCTHQQQLRQVDADSLAQWMMKLPYVNLFAVLTERLALGEALQLEVKMQQAMWNAMPLKELSLLSVRGKADTPVCRSISCCLLMLHTGARCALYAAGWAEQTALKCRSLPAQPRSAIRKAMRVEWRQVLVMPLRCSV